MTSTLQSFKNPGCVNSYTGNFDFNENNTFTNLFTQVPNVLKVSICSVCQIPINKEYHLKVSDRLFHPNCLRCSYCNVKLNKERICYIKGSEIICSCDYKRYFSIKCVRCSKILVPDDWVRNTFNRIYHISCFSCDLCKRQLKTGEKFILLGDKLLCGNHEDKLNSNKENADNNMELNAFQQIQRPNINQNTLLSQNVNCVSSEEGSLNCIQILSKSNANEKICRDSFSQPNKFDNVRSKRIRTNFNEKQIEILQASFDNDPNPDTNELERIALATGLSKRVTQVWFQNSRARQKKFRDTTRENTNLSEPLQSNGTQYLSNQVQDFDQLSYNDEQTEVSPLSYFNDSSLDTSSCDDGL